MDSSDWMWAAFIIAAWVVHHVRMLRAERELSRLRILAGEFAESDIEVIFRQAVSLEGSSRRDEAAKLYQLVATHSNDADNVRLASESIRRINEPAQ
ncbi:MAG: hypothetical protein ACR2NM_07235 [Bythopirellula sp.]